MDILIIILIIVIIYLYIDNNKQQPTNNNHNNHILKEDNNHINHILKENNHHINNNHNDETNDINLYNFSQKQAYIDIEYINYRNRVIINLAIDIVPKTCNNFASLCYNKSYKNSSFHRIIRDFMIQGGDFINNNGTGSTSIYGKTFTDENFKLKHNKGVISMANSGPNTNGCQFFITTKDTPWLDGTHVVFGNIIKGMDLIEYLENIPVDENDKPLDEVKIVDCGLL